MKYLGIIVALLMTITGCNAKHIDYTDGTIKLTTLGENVTTPPQMYKSSSFERKLHSAVKNSDGSYTFEFTGKYGYYVLSFGGYDYVEVYVLPNKPLKVIRKMKDGNPSYMYEGATGAQNRYHIAAEKLSFKLRNEHVGNRDKNAPLVKADEEEITQLLKEKRDKQIDLLNQYIKDESIHDQRFIKLERDYITHEYHITFNYVPIYKKMAGVEFKPSDTYYDFFDEFDFNNQEMFEQKNEYSKVLSSPYTLIPQGEPLYKYFEFVGTRCKNSFMISKIFSSAGRMLIGNAEGDDFEKTMLAIKKFCTDDVTLKKLQKFYDERKAGMPGSPAPEFSYVPYDGKTYSLNDFKGKYLVIDFWATWCGPCKKQTPYFEQQAINFRDKNVVFVAISLDDNTKKWKEYIEKHKLQNIQLLSPKKQKSKFSNLFCNSGIPRFVLIDPEGKIVTGRFPVPSDEKFAKELNKHLN